MAENESSKSGKEAAEPAPPAPTKAQPRTFQLQALSQAPIKVQHVASPPAYPRRERIHPRRVLPRVKEGRERDFHSTTRELSAHLLQPLASGLRASTDDVA